MKPISVYVEEDDYWRFKSLVAVVGRPVAELIREAMASYLVREGRPGQSVLDIPAHPSSRMLSGWTRSELADEMIDG